MATWKICLWISFWTCGSVCLAETQDSLENSTISGEVKVASGAVSGLEKATKAPVSFWEEVLSNPLWLMMAMLLVFYVGVLLPSQRSNKRQQRELADLISSLKKNDRVVTSFGVHGVVVSTQSEAGTVTIRLDENSNAKMTVNRDTIRVVKKD